MTRHKSWLTVLAASALLAACAGSSPARYYTLLPAAGTAPAMPPVNPRFALEVLPVTLPVQVDQPQIMLRTTGDALMPVYSERWAAPLDDELQAALSHAMTATLGVPDVTALGASAGMPVWRVQVDVQRLDMVLGGPALIDATWRVRHVSDGSSALLCRSVASVPATGNDVAALVQAQQQAVAQLAATMASAISRGGKPGASTAQVQMLGCNHASPGK